MSRSKGTPSAGTRLPGPMGILSITVIAIVAVGALIMFSGGFAEPTAAPEPPAVAEPSDRDGPIDDAMLVAGGPVEVEELTSCGGQPCPEKGAANAPVTVIEVSDYGCSHCRDHNLDVAPLLELEFVDTGKVRLVSHVFGASPRTEYLASAALCAAEQDAYWAFHDVTFDRNLAQSQDLLQDLAAAAEAIGLDTGSFLDCAERSHHIARVRTSTSEAQRARLLYTPTFIINGLIIEGGQDIEVFRQKIEQAIAESS